MNEMKETILNLREYAESLIRYYETDWPLLQSPEKLKADRLRREVLEKIIDYIDENVMPKLEPRKAVTNTYDVEELMPIPTKDEILKKANIKSLEDLDKTTRFGYQLENDEDTYYIFPKGVKEKIKRDGRYRIYYKWHDSADSSDSTTWYHIFYIEELPPTHLGD